ncbi:hypothetical protein RFI_27428, partial [Reticulomyxa filosa]
NHNNNHNNNNHNNNHNNHNNHNGNDNNTQRTNKPIPMPSYQTISYLPLLQDDYADETEMPRHRSTTDAQEVFSSSSILKGSRVIAGDGMGANVNSNGNVYIPPLSTRNGARLSDRQQLPGTSNNNPTSFTSASPYASIVALQVPQRRRKKYDLGTPSVETTLRGKTWKMMLGVGHISSEEYISYCKKKQF